MKFISIFYKTAVVVALVMSVTSCSDDDDNIITPPVTLDIVETVQRNTDLGSLVAALGTANGDLSNVLKGDGPFTVLAPTNAAFEEFLKDENGDKIELSDVPKDVLESILLNHVISGTLRASDLESGDGTGYVTTESKSGFDGSALSLYYNASSGVQFNGGATVSEPDTEATNGIIHIIDAVIELPKVTTFAAADPNFSQLLQGLTAHTFDYVTTLEGNGPFTVFAPDNAAFGALLDTNPDWNTPGDIPEATLESALNLHVISGANVRKADLTNGDVMTLGGNILVDATVDQETLTDGSQPDVIVSKIIATDVQATNGVIHVIDKVLLTARPN